MLSLLDHFTKQTCHSKCPKSSQLDNINPSQNPAQNYICIITYFYIPWLLELYNSR